MRSVILATPTRHAGDESAPTLASERSTEHARLREIASRFGAKVEWLADGSIVVATDCIATPATGAEIARCALAMREALPGARLAAALGDPGEAVGLAYDLLKRSASTTGDIRLHESVRRLLENLRGSRFALSVDQWGHVLAGERDAEQALPPVIAGRYKVKRELGRGGMGAVFLVEHAHTGEQHALKILHAHAGLDARALERFKREARAPARIRSDHVVKITDADVAPELGGAPFLVMELLEGADLEKRVERAGRLTPEVVTEIFAQIARALEKAHALGIVHRDLKPENIFMHRREDGTEIVKVLDFGISKIVESGAGDIAKAGLTGADAVLGTPLYMSPEQARGQNARIGPATDVWALGLIAVRLLSAETYWRANTIAELMAQILSEPLYAPSTRWPHLSRAFDAWFLRSCDREPAARWPSVSEQAAALGRALAMPLSSGDWAGDARAVIPERRASRAAAGVQPSPAVSVAAGTTDAALSQSHAARTASAPLGRRAVALGAVGAVLVAAVVGWRVARSWTHEDAGPAITVDAAASVPSAATSSLVTTITAQSGEPPAAASSAPTPSVTPSAVPSARRAVAAPPPSSTPSVAPSAVPKPAATATATTTTTGRYQPAAP